MALRGCLKVPFKGTRRFYNAVPFKDSIGLGLEGVWDLIQRVRNKMESCNFAYNPN